MDGFWTDFSETFICLNALLLQDNFEKDNEIHAVLYRSCASVPNMFLFLVRRSTVT